MTATQRWLSDYSVPYIKNVAALLPNGMLTCELQVDLITCMTTGQLLQSAPQSASARSLCENRSPEIMLAMQSMVVCMCEQVADKEAGCNRSPSDLCSNMLLIRHMYRALQMMCL